MKIVSLSCMFLSLFSFNLKAQDTIHIVDFGLQPNTRENAIPYIRKALEVCKSKKNIILAFPKGRYDFWPQEDYTSVYHESNTDDINPKYLAIQLKNMNQFTIDGKESEFVMHGRIQPVTIDHSQNITVKNFSIDWDIPLTTQGEVVNVGSDYFDVVINTHESPYIFEDGKLYFVGEGWRSEFRSWIMEFRPDSRIVEPYTGDNDIYGNGSKKTKIEPLSEGIVRITCLEKDFKRLPTKGNILVLRHSSRDHAGLFSCHSKNVTVENIQMYHTCGLGMLFQYTENIRFINTSVAPNKVKKRTLSGHDDGFHIMGCKGQVDIDNCTFAGLMDDPINVHGTCVRIIKIISPTQILCKFMHPQSQGMVWGQSGDKVGFIENKSMSTVGTGLITSFKVLNLEEFEVELNKPLPKEISEGAALENLTWIPDVNIRNSYFGPCRARGVLLSTSGKIIVENNIFESSGSAILIAGDANYWYESGAVKDVMIRNNDFRYSCMSSMYQFCQAIISIEPEIPEPDSQKPFHRNIRIENNLFHPFDYPILYAKSVDGLSFVANAITRSHEIEPFHPRKAGITLDACKAVTISNNTISGEVLGKDIVYENMNPKEIKVGNKEFFKLKKK